MHFDSEYLCDDSQEEFNEEMYLKSAVYFLLYEQMVIDRHKC